VSCLPGDFRAFVVGGREAGLAGGSVYALAGDEYPAVRAAVASIDGVLAELRAALAAIRLSLP
jgi:hypothetical protein